MSVTTEGNVYVGIGKRIEALRKQKGEQLGKKFTQEMLAQALRVDRSLVAKWESYTRKISAEEMLKVCDFFDISLDYLLTGVNPENRTIASELGLNEESIQTLRLYKDKVSRTIVNTFLSKENEGLRLFCRTWPQREFLEVYDKLSKCNVYLHWDKEEYLNGLSEHDLLFNSLSYSLNANFIEEYFKRFLNQVSKNYWFEGDEEKYKERAAEIIKEYKDNVKDCYYKGYFEEASPEMQAMMLEGIERLLNSDS